MARRYRMRRVARRRLGGEDPFGYNAAAATVARKRSRYEKTHGTTHVDTEAVGLMPTIRLSKPRGKHLSQNVIKKFVFAPYIFRWQNVNPIDRTTQYNPTLGGQAGTQDVEIGAMRLDFSFVGSSNIASTLTVGVGSATNQMNLGDLTGTSRHLKMPVHCYCLNDLTTSELDPTGPAYQMLMDLEDNSLKFQRMFGAPNSQAVTTAQPQWLLEKTDDYTGPLDNLPGTFFRNAWYDINLTLRNSTAQATIFEVFVCSFKEDHYDPLEIPNYTPEVDSRRAFWTSFAMKGLNHPMIKRPELNDTDHGMRVYRYHRVKFEAQLTTQTDQSPACQILKLFYRDGATLDYRIGTDHSGAGESVTNRLASYRNPNLWEGQTKESYNVEVVPRPRSRKWLIIRAFDPTLSALGTLGEATTVGPGFAPSYDIILRKKVEMVRS